MNTVVERAVREMPLLTRTQALEEGRHDPRFWRYFSSLALSTTPGRSVDDDMKKAVINELDPKSYRETAGRWPMLRAKVRELRARLSDHAYVFGSLAAIAANGATTAAAPEANIWSAISSAISAAGSAAANIYTTKITNDATKEIAKTQAQVLAAQQAALAQQQAAAQAAAQQAAVYPTGGGAPASSDTGSIILYVVMGLLGLGGLYFLINMLTQGKR